MSAGMKTVPRHIAIIMDGNGRWAKSRGFPRIKGHEAGAQAVRECVEGCGELKVEYLSLYAFSAENWQRPKGEVIALMRLLEKFLKEKTPELIEKNVRLQAIGRLTDLPESSQKQLHKTIEQTAGNTGLTLILALSYGGRLEIFDGIKSLLRAVELGHIDKGMIDVEMFSKLRIAPPASAELRRRRHGDVTQMLPRRNRQEIYLCESARICHSIHEAIRAQQTHLFLARSVAVP